MTDGSTKSLNTYTRDGALHKVNKSWRLLLPWLDTKSLMNVIGTVLLDKQMIWHYIKGQNVFLIRPDNETVRALGSHWLPKDTVGRQIKRWHCSHNYSIHGTFNVIYWQHLGTKKFRLPCCYAAIMSYAKCLMLIIRTCWTISLSCVGSKVLVYKS